MRPIEKRELTIKGVKWKIKRVPPGHKLLEDNYGCVDYDTTTMYLRKNLTPETMWNTFWHEVAHIIAFGYDKLDLTEEWGVEATAGELMNITRQLGLLD